MGGREKRRVREWRSSPDVAELRAPDIPRTAAGGSPAQVLYAEHCRAHAAALQGEIAAVPFSRRPMLATLGLDFSLCKALSAERKGMKLANTLTREV